MKTNKWKMALLVWSAMFPFSTALNYGLTQLSFTAQWPLVARTFCLTCLLVPYMVFGAFPFFNRYFERWLRENTGTTQTPEHPAGTGPTITLSRRTVVGPSEAGEPLPA